MATRDLTLGSLRDQFFVNEASWAAYQLRNGRIKLADVANKQGQHNVAMAVRNGARVLARYSGVSGKEVLAIARRKAA